jgi:hypothetical protein
MILTFNLLLGLCQELWICQLFNLVLTESKSKLKVCAYVESRYRDNHSVDIAFAQSAVRLLKRISTKWISFFVEETIPRDCFPLACWKSELNRPPLRKDSRSVHIDFNAKASHPNICIQIESLSIENIVR